MLCMCSQIRRNLLMLPEMRVKVIACKHWAAGVSAPATGERSTCIRTWGGRQLISVFSISLSPGAGTWLARWSPSCTRAWTRPARARSAAGRPRRGRRGSGQPSRRSRIRWSGGQKRIRWRAKSLIGNLDRGKRLALHHHCVALVLLCRHETSKPSRAKI